MDIPKFEFANIDSRLFGGDIGHAFQSFVFQALRPRFPDLRYFPAGGKDGGIDLLEPDANGNTVVECKHIGSGSFSAAPVRWRTVARNLGNNLLDPAGPPKGQAQYEPWFRTDPPINKYVFCVICESGPHPPETLKSEIRDFFVALGTDHAHLAHLKDIDVEIISWNQFGVWLLDTPHLAFRWFPACRPQGLVPLDTVPETGRFRAYLSSDNLPYYSRKDHQNSSDSPFSDVADEAELLNQLSEPDTNGIVITGSGGLGKTRLSIELARLAQDQGWVVLQAQSTIRDQAIEQLASQVNPNVKVLLLLDYLETFRGFQEFSETLTAYNNNLDLKIKYVANCRTSYYSTIADIAHQKRVNLSPPSNQEQRAWLEAYQGEVIRHILRSCGLEITPRHLAVCRNTPVLAVFLAYLRSQGRDADLAELLDEEDFGAWVRSG